MTGTQTFVGSSVNTFTYKFKSGTNAKNYNVTKEEGTLTVTDTLVPGEFEKVIKKTHDDKEYALGETVTFTIKITNIYGEEKVAAVSEIPGVSIAGPTQYTMKPGEVIDVTAAYVVTEADILAQEFKNTVTVKFDGKEYTDDDIVDVVEKDAKLAVDKEVTNTPAEGTAYVLGETVAYEITVANTGNVTIKNILVEDPLTGGRWNIPSLAPGAAQNFETSYVVTTEDITNNGGKITNIATANGTDLAGEPVEASAKEEVAIVTPNPSITLIKNATNADSVNGAKVGDVVTYEITVTNTGNVVVSNLKVKDALVDFEETIASLAPLASKTYTVDYTVTEADVINGKVLNVATATGTAANGTDVKDEAEEEVLTENAKSELTLTKETTSKAAADDKYALGETITYKITAANTGNLTLTNVVVTDELTGDEWKVDSEMKPGDKVEFTAEYVVTETDIKEGKVLNVATAAAEDKDPDSDPKEVKAQAEDPTEAQNPAVEIDKKMLEEIAAETGEAKAKWIVGDTIKYEIIVKNTGNITLTDLTVDDDMNAAGDAKFTNLNELIAGGIEIETVDQDTIVLKTLAPEAEVKILAEYTILREDAGKEISNIAVADNEQIEPKVDVEPTPIERLYNLTIHYVDAAGNVLAPQYTAELVEGEIVSVTSPVIAGYTTNVLTVTTAPDGMPAKDVEIYVVYTAIPSPGSDEDDPEPTPDPVTPEPTPMPEPVPTPEPGPAPAPAPVAPPVEVSESGTYAIVEDGEGGYILTPIEEIEVPLADIDLDEHKCCILHFLITLAALIILAVYMKNQKKRQERVFELRETIELEKTKRDLGEGKAVSEAEGEE